MQKTVITHMNNPEVNTDMNPVVTIGMNVGGNTDMNHPEVYTHMNH